MVPDEAGYFADGQWIPVPKVCGNCHHLTPYEGPKPIPDWVGFCGRYDEKNNSGVTMSDTCKYWQWNNPDLSAEWLIVFHPAKGPA